jgi:hypothetical protein
MSKVIMKFAPGKPVETKVEGIPGADCRVASKPYLDVLAGAVVSDTKTAEADLPPLSTGVGVSVSQ